MDNSQDNVSGENQEEKKSQIKLRNRIAANRVKFCFFFMIRTV